MKKTACIITGGELEEPFVSEFLHKNPNVFKIVVDGALELTHRL